MMLRSLILSVLFIQSLCVSAQVEFSHGDDSLTVIVNSREFATYVFRDDEIPRPFFHSIHTKGGTQVTRNHPPVKGVDLDDHADYHPGLWMAFGDISGHDFWRNKARVEHAGFISEPRSRGDQGSFTILNRYLGEGDTICLEECAIEISAHDDGIAMVWSSVFYSNDAPFHFGDQEEMGLGIRMATPLIVRQGGTILNQQGGRDEDGVWGETSNWSACYGEAEVGVAGAMISTSPGNPRPSWFHARDYGLLVANLFGRKAFTGGEASRITVTPGERLQLKYGVFIFEQEEIDHAFFARTHHQLVSLMENE